MAGRESAETVIVLGGGPAGLGAALGARQAGAASVVVVERQEDPGQRRRGETLRRNEQVEALLEPGFFERHTRHRLARRRYHSPSGKRQVERQIANPNRIIQWPDLIADLTRLARSRGATVLHGWTATALELDDEGVAQVRLRRPDGTTETRPAGCVVGADGHDGLCAGLLGQDRRAVDFPIRKLLVRGGACSPEWLEYQLHVGPDGLALIGCLFPRGGDEAEVLIMGWRRAPADGVGGAQRLGWEPLADFEPAHPAFTALYAGGEVLYEQQTHIPMGGLLYPVVPLPRLILAGDLVGQVQARGGSGIVSSLGLGHQAGTLAAGVACQPGRIGPAQRLALEQAIAAHPLAVELRRQQLLLGRARRELFARLPTPAAFDRAWPLAKLLLR